MVPLKKTWCHFVLEVVLLVDADQLETMMCCQVEGESGGFWACDGTSDDHSVFPACGDILILHLCCDVPVSALRGCRTERSVVYNWQLYRSVGPLPVD